VNDKGWYDCNEYEHWAAFDGARPGEWGRNTRGRRRRRSSSMHLRLLKYSVIYLIVNPQLLTSHILTT
jgi:hypothetical protein